MQQFRFVPSFPITSMQKHRHSGNITLNGREYKLTNVNAIDGHYWNIQSSNLPESPRRKTRLLAK
ncbi:MAG: hypothetical protein M2R46_03954 [Verrucomicrobia subdivision 3 bacterium]|nr:hypothetical protein [Limisphaerales bacterium]